MDDSGTRAYNLQIEPKDECHPSDSVESTVTPLPSVSDENENQLEGDGCGHLTGSDGAMGKPKAFEQDSLNNNENCTLQCEVAASENLENTPGEGPRDGQAFWEKDKKIPGKKCSRSKKATAKKMLPGLSSGDSAPLLQEKAVSAAARAVGEEEAAEINARERAETPKLPLQLLFPLIRGEVGQLDSRALPLCLHQIAESYFQEEDYEKAMKFIQLERLYHEQLLANLSAIQEQWETKWKTVQPHTVPSQRNSEKGFNGEDFERLTKFCTTHRDPLLSKHKIAAVEQSLGRKDFTQLIVSEDPKQRVTESERETYPGMEPSEESQPPGETQDSSSPCCNQMDGSADSSSLPAAAGKDHREEPLGSAAATRTCHTQPSEAAGSRSGPDSSENPRQDDSHLQLPAAETCQDVARTEGIAKDPKVFFSNESMIEPLIVPGCDHIPPALSAEGEHPQRERKELSLPLPDAAVLPTDQLENKELNEPQPPEPPDRDGKSPQSHRDSGGSERELRENDKAPDLSLELPGVYMAPEERGDRDDDEVSKETEDYLNSLLEGCLKNTHDSLSYEDNQEEDSDLIQDLSPEEESYSLQENLPSDDSCLSLDDLAKRIEIAEVVPAEGLVSILKKRNNAVGNHPSPMQQKPSKRRVRFQEIDENLDQDEVGGGSCILLILLCIATVFLSVGGTALYCSFGDMESPVCTDFADNMDFYYTKLLQGMAQLKHWIYLS